MTACPYCQTYGPNTHSFSQIAESPQFGRIMYTCIAKATDYSNAKAISTHFMSEIKESDSWTWIFDCRDLKTIHTLQFDVAVTLCKMIRDKFSDKLQRLIIVNPTPGIDTMVKHVLPLFSKDSLQYLRKFKGSHLEIYLALQKEGMEEASCQAIIQQLRS